MATGGGFIGRRRDLAELDTALEAGVAGRGQLVLMPGEAGIGKARLAQEVAARARGEGLRCGLGRLYRGGGASRLLALDAAPADPFAPSSSSDVGPGRSPGSSRNWPAEGGRLPTPIPSWPASNASTP